MGIKKCFLIPEVAQETHQASREDLARKLPKTDGPLAEGAARVNLSIIMCNYIFDVHVYSYILHVLLHVCSNCYILHVSLYVCSYILHVHVCSYIFDVHVVMHVFICNRTYT